MWAAVVDLSICGASDFLRASPTCTGSKCVFGSGPETLGSSTSSVVLLVRAPYRAFVVWSIVVFWQPTPEYSLTLQMWRRPNPVYGNPSISGVHVDIYHGVQDLPLRRGGGQGGELPQGRL